MRGSISKGLVSIIAMLLLMTMVTPAMAASTVESQTLVTPVEPGADSHGYVYVPGTYDQYRGLHQVYHTTPISMKSYRYDQSSWSTNTQSFPVEDTTNRYGSNTHLTENQGWFGNYTTYPIFYDLTNTTMQEWMANLTERRYVFGAQMDADVFALAEENEYTYGTLSIPSGVEFVHLEISSGTDWYEAYVSVIDPLGRVVIDDWTFDTGDIAVIPFPVTTAGQYTIVFWGYSDYDIQFPLTFHPTSVAPTTIGDGEVYQDTIEGSEVIVDQGTGDFIYRESEPQAITYKVSTPEDIEGLLRFTSNPSPALWLPTDVQILVQSPVFEPTPSGQSLFMDSLSYSQGRYYYRSFQGEAYYITIYGHGEFPFTISNALVNLPSLPTNTPLYYEDEGSEMHAYSFDISSPTLLRINYTSLAGSFSLKLWSVDDTDLYRDLYPSSADTFEDSYTYYVAPGNYILTVEGGVNPDNVWFIEFNTAPVVTSGTDFAVNLGSLAGFRTTLSQLGWWRFNASLLSQDNVTVRYELEIFNEYGQRIMSTTDTMANHEDNGEWTDYSGYDNESQYTVPYDFNEDVIVSISVYDVENNSYSVDTNYLHYTTSFRVVKWDYESAVISGSVFLATGVDNHNFTLVDPTPLGGLTEYFVLETSVSAGTWMKMMVESDNVDSYNIRVLQNYDNYVMTLSQTYLDGTVSMEDGVASYQFGAISNTVKLLITVTRHNSFDGWFSIAFDEYNTQTLAAFSTPGLVAPSGVSGDMTPLVIGVGVIGAVVIIAVVIVVLKKRSS